ncbi:MAG: hypothetical protein ACTS73_01640 [Arsenophonus sp. NEOnobi-MAG3]
MKEDELYGDLYNRYDGTFKIKAFDTLEQIEQLEDLLKAAVGSHKVGAKIEYYKSEEYSLLKKR